MPTGYLLTLTGENHIYRFENIQINISVVGIYTSVKVTNCMISSRGSIGLNYRANILPDTEQILKDG